MAVGARRAASFPAAIVRSEAALPLGLLAPTVIFLSLLILVPIAQAVLLSFQAADGTFGLDAYNTILTGLGLIKEPMAFLSYENLQWVFTAVVVAESWRATALVLVILLAGLQLIPREYFEAAELFGASRLKRTLVVVLPMLKPSL